jgi:hypothetical protein
VQLVADVVKDYFVPGSISFLEAVGLSVIPPVSAFKARESGSLWTQLRPSRGTLLQSDGAAHEHMARVYCWLQGWLRQSWVPRSHPTAAPVVVTGPHGLYDG